MADTIQVVSWSLAQSCKLRTGDAAHETEAAFAAVGRAATYASYVGRPRGEFGLFGDVCVTSYTSAQVPPGLKGTRAAFPCGGFVLSESFRGVGGTGGLEAMCRACPANANGDRPAGCAGTIYQDPDSPATQAQLEAILSRLGLADACAEAFLPTTPIWYGLWARSPLSPPAVRLLGTVLGEMYAEDKAELRDAPGGGIPDHLPRLRQFLRATELAERHGLPLHVSLAPLGHTDLGYYTVFPHCPVCKAAAHLPRWRTTYPTQLHTCAVCGTAFPPAETASSERTDFADEALDLRRTLGERFPAFAKAYVMATGGVGEADAAEVVAFTEAWERERSEKLAAERRRHERKERYVRSVLYAGLHPTYDRGDDDGGDSDDDRRAEAADPGVAGTAYFDAAECEELLRRCEGRGFRVGAMFHSSKTEELSRYAYRRLSRPADVLAKWRAEGCNERFSVTVLVPDDVVDAWESGNRGG